ncbi:MAG: Gfo/Idh/MocA family protein [Mangrovibacterium sp.]
MERRKFLKSTAALTAGLTTVTGAFALPGSSRIIGANDKIRIGFIGVGNRGSELLGLFMQQPDCEVAALCDVYEPYLQRDRSKVDERWLSELTDKIPKMGEKFEKKPKLYTDFRKLLDDKDIDAVCIATPDHWHAYITIAAIKAGKDVYCEKPLTNTLREGREMVTAQAASKQVVAVGINRRGNVAYQNLAKEIHAGKIGQITVGRATHINDMFPKGIGKMHPEQPPKDFNWDMWLGPRAFRPYQYNIAPYKFRWWSDFSSQMGNWGVHHLDALRWMMEETAPVFISAHGGKYVLDHDGDIDDTAFVTFEFASGKIISYSIMEATGGSMFPYGELELRGTKGIAYAYEGGYRINPASAGQFQSWNKHFEEEAFDNKLKLLGDASSADSTTGLIRNFLDCVKSRQIPLCPLEEGHRSTSFAHLANIALATKERLQWDAKNEQFVNSKKANEMLGYEYRSPWKI